MLKKCVFGVCVAIVAAGCGTIMDTGNIGNAAGSNGPHVYGGVRGDMQLISESDSAVSSIVLVLDMVPSVLYDTVLLPASLANCYSKP